MYLSDITSIKIDCTKEEITDIAFDINHRLLETARDHWYSHFVSGYKAEDKPKSSEFISYIKEKERVRLEKISFLFGLVGYTHIVNGLDSDLTEVFNKKQIK
jgi:hypothetical protein